MLEMPQKIKFKNKIKNKKHEKSTTPCLAANVCYGLPFLQDIALGGLCKTHNYYDSKSKFRTSH